MPLFSQAEIDAAREREAARDASLRATTAEELRTWLTAQDDVADAVIHPDAPGTVAVRLADGLLAAVTVSTDDVPADTTAPSAAAHQALAERIRTWLTGEAGIGQTWLIPRTSALGVELEDGTYFTITVSPRT
ncbi:hypothetical protein ACF09H_32225 [Streptomyces sp. NPDC014983]|uniref:hypothetical protein n=1 Tax=Streptomyces sp. NPDC014983 TaxID=3364933 RepID=UPI0036FFBE05